MKKKTIAFIIKLLRATLYVLSAGHLCSCKNGCECSEADKEENIDA